jgi:hypothetical protein
VKDLSVFLDNVYHCSKCFIASHRVTSLSESTDVGTGSATGSGSTTGSGIRVSG